MDAVRRIADGSFLLKQGEAGTPVAQICGKGGDKPDDVIPWKREEGRL